MLISLLLEKSIKDIIDELLSIKRIYWNVHGFLRYDARHYYEMFQKKPDARTNSIIIVVICKFLILDYFSLH